MSIKVSHLSKSYGSQKAVNDVSFQIASGEIVGFLGPNGAGKSTVMKIITQYIRDFEGDVWVEDQSVKTPEITVRKQIGYLPEHNPLYVDMYVREYLAFHAEVYGVSKDRIAAIIEEVGLIREAHKKIKALSKGYRQRVGLAAALLHEPEVLILDEPTTGLDPNQLTEIRALIKKVGQQRTVLFSTHILQEVEAICDRVIILNKGEMVADEQLHALRSEKIQIVEVEFDVKVEKELLQKLLLPTYLNNVYDTTWELHFESTTDARVSVFDFAHDQDLKILNLVRKHKGLEELFRELTQ